MTAEPLAQTICRTPGCAGAATGSLGFCPACLSSYRNLREAEHAARTSLAEDLLDQIPLVPGLTRLHRRALAARAAVYALRAGARPGAQLQELWLDLAFVDLAEDLARATKRVTDLGRIDAQVFATSSDITSTARHW